MKYDYGPKIGEYAWNFKASIYVKLVEITTVFNGQLAAISTRWSWHIYLWLQ